MSDQTVNLALPYILPSQAQKHCGAAPPLAQIGGSFGTAKGENLTRPERNRLRELEA